jgi:hypothetical protein
VAECSANEESASSIRCSLFLPPTAIQWQLGIHLASCRAHIQDMATTSTSKELRSASSITPHHQMLSDRDFSHKEGKKRHRHTNGRHIHAANQWTRTYLFFSALCLLIFLGYRRTLEVPQPYWMLLTTAFSCVASSPYFDCFLLSFPSVKVINERVDRQRRKWKYPALEFRDGIC